MKARILALLSLVHLTACAGAAQEGAERQRTQSLAAVEPSVDGVLSASDDAPSELTAANAYVKRSLGKSESTRRKNLAQIEKAISEAKADVESGESEEGAIKKWSNGSKGWEKEKTFAESMTEEELNESSDDSFSLLDAAKAARVAYCFHCYNVAIAAHAAYANAHWQHCARGNQPHCAAMHAHLHAIHVYQSQAPGCHNA